MAALARPLWSATRSVRSSSLVKLCGVIWFAAWAVPSTGADFTWKEPVSGTFSDAARWAPSGGPPGLGSTAIFSVNGSYTVSGPGNPSILQIQNGDVTFDDSISATGPSSGATAFIGLAGSATARLTKTASLTSTLPVAMGVAGQGKLILDGSASAQGITGVAAAFNLGFSGVGEIEINDGGSLVSNGKLLIGSSGIGTVTVHHGGHIQAISQAPDSAIDLAGGANSHGTLNVEGNGEIPEDASVVTNSQINVGFGGVGKLLVTNGGFVQSPGNGASAPGLLLGYVAGGSGELRLDASKFTAGTQTVIGGGGTGFVKLLDGSRLESVTPGSNIFSSILGNEAGSSGAVTISNDSTWFNERGVVIGNAGGGSLEASDGAKFLRPADSQYSIVLAKEQASIGYVTISGKDTVFAIGAKADLVVGAEGAGSFNSDGASLETRSLFVGAATLFAPPDLNRSLFVMSGESSESKAVLNVHETISVGNQGRGTMTLFSDVTANANAMVLGNSSSGDGVFISSGTGTTLTIADDLRVGQEGKGQFNVTNHSTVTVTHEAIFGAFGNATLDVNTNGKLTSGNAFLGFFNASTSGVATIASNGEWTVNGDIQVGGKGVGILDVQPGGKFSATNVHANKGGIVYGGGDLTGETIYNGGTFAPGASPFAPPAPSTLLSSLEVHKSVGSPSAPARQAAVLSVFGDYIQLREGTLTIHIHGANPGTEFDVLSVLGSATLAGTVEIDFKDFIPSVGQEFEFLTSHSLSGQFEVVNVSNLEPGLFAELVYDQSRIKVLVTNVPETSTLALAALGAFVVLAGHRKVKRQGQADLMTFG